jgi:hypothetical protein
MTIIKQTVLCSYTKLELTITLAGRDESVFDVYCVFENCNCIFDSQIRMNSLQVDIQNFLLHVFFLQKIIKEYLPSLITMHGRKFCT